MARRILWASLALAPVSILVHYAADVGQTAEFVLAAAALIPLAWLIGEATEHAAHHTGAGIGGFLNATFGNAPELIIALFAVATLLFLIPAVPALDGDPERRSIAELSIIPSVALLAIYVVVTYLSLRRHHQLHIADGPSEMRAWSLTASLAVLGVATVVT